MKTCVEYQESMSAYMDGELQETETAGLFSHLGKCSECRSFMQSLLQLRTVLHEEQLPETAHPSLWKRSIAVTYPIAAVIGLFMLLSGYVVLSKMIQPPVETTSIKTEYVYLTSLPPVYIIGVQSTNLQSN